MAGFCALPGAPLHAQQLNIQTLRSERGLPQAQVLAVHQDSVGYLWVGSYGGLSRYDGTEFTTFSIRDGLPNNQVTALVAGAAGRLVLGTGGGGVCFMDAGRFECPPLPPEPEWGDVRALLRDPSGGVWAATAEGVIHYTEGSRKAFTTVEGLLSRSTSALAWDEGGSLLVGTDGGLVRLEGNGFVPEAPDVLGSDPVRLLERTSRGLLVGSSSGLFLRERGELRRQALPEGTQGAVFRAAAEDTSGALWVATENRGALRFGGGRWERLTTRNGLPTDELYSVLVDRERTVWLGGLNGLVKLVPGPFTTYSDGVGALGTTIRAISGDARGRLWLGTRAGVRTFDGGGFRIVVPPEELPGSRALALEPLPDGSVLIGTPGGLVVWKDGVRQVLRAADGLPNERVRSLLADPSGGAWVGTAEGVVHWKAGRLAAFPDDSVLSRAAPLDMRYDRRGRLWMALESGQAAIVDSVGGRLVEVEAGSVPALMWSLDLDPEGRMWIGTNGDGAYQVDEDGTVLRHLDTGSGLANDWVWSVLCSADSSVWLYTSRGLDRVRGREILHYTISDGLADMEGNATASWEAPDGTVWFGAGSSLIEYRAEREFRNTRVPPVLVQASMDVGGALLPGARIPAASRGLTFRFTALSFRNEEEVRFRHRLLGLSDEWSPPSRQRTVSYGGLPPGRLELQVVGSNDNGVWSTEPAVLPFEVLPAFWQTWTFRSGVVLLLALLGGAAHRARLRHTEVERRRLETLVAERTRSLEERTRSLQVEIRDRERAEEEKERLAADLLESRKLEAVGRLAGGVAHEYNNLMTAVLANADILASELPDGSSLRAEAGDIRTAARRAAAITRQLMAVGRKQMMRPAALDLNAVVRDNEPRLRGSTGGEISLVLDLDPDLRRIWADRGSIEEILSALAENARDAMSAGGRLTVGTRNRGGGEEWAGGGTERAPSDCVHLWVADTGTGFEPWAAERAFEPFFTTKGFGARLGLGLATAHGLVLQLGGDIHIESEPGAGATVHLWLPCHQGE